MGKSIQEHTPGPWTFKASGEANEYFLMKDGNWLAMVRQNGEMLVALQEANARFIAAAPETAAERDRLKKQNEELVAAIRGLLVEVDAYLDYARAGDPDKGMDDAADVVKAILFRTEVGA